MKVTSGTVKVLFTFLVLSAVVYGGYLLLREAETKAPALFQRTAGVRLLMSMNGFRFLQSENGAESWRMKAATADLYENKEARLRDIEILFQSPDKREAVLRGELGTMDTETGDGILRRAEREVRIVTSDGYLLTADSLAWRAGERIVRTPDVFKLLGSEIYLEGRGFSANVDIRKITVNDNVKAVLQE